MELPRSGTGDDSSDPTLPIESRRRQFEDQWRAGPRPRIEAFLEPETEESHRFWMFQSLLDAEVALRRQGGEQPRASDYRDRFPAWIAQIEAACVGLTEAETRPTPPSKGPGKGSWTTWATSFPGGQDRDMLIGLLAYQNGFIEYETLVDAMHAWFANKARPLGLTLVGWKMLDEGQLDALERMADQHVKRDGGDVSRSVATATETVSLADLGPQPDPEAETIQVNLGPGGRRRPHDRQGSRYRILRHHARGGLGDVYVAQDEELGRKVALKEIRPKHVGNLQSRARFLLEAEVTGNLEHPGIVPVYGQGEYPDGRPFYAMKFIKGKTLKEAVIDFRQDRSLDDQPGERTLALRRLLGRFVDVCDAIEYAHNRGVLHRDLKPSNIMLGKYGETLVVDWGLAKILGHSGSEDSGSSEFHDEEALHPSSSSEVEPTRMLSISGTPQYMSPEQAEGQIDQLTSTTDVYGLGSTLYFLLTGRSTFPEKMSLDKIKPLLLTGDFPRPREVDSQVPPALESICLKALAVEPRKRYLSARALADDIERWLADEPVSAHPDKITARAARWVRGHRPQVSAALATLIAAVIGLSISTVIVSIERNKADRLRVIAQNSDERAQDALARIEQTLGLTKEAITELMVTLAGQKLATTPQLQGLRAYVADKSVAISRNLLRQRPDDLYIKFTAAPIMHHAGVMHRLVGQYDVSFPEFEQAIEFYKALAAQKPEGRLAMLASQAGVTIDYAEAVRLGGDSQTALKLFDAVHDLALSMKQENPSNLLYEQPLARSNTNAAEILLTLGRFQEALQKFDEGVRIISTRVNRANSSPVERVLLFYAIRGQGKAASELGDLEQAAHAFDQAEKAIKDLEAQNGSDNNTRYFHATVHAERGLMLSRAPQTWARAEAEMTTAIDLIDQLIKAGFGAVFIYKTDLAYCRIYRATLRCEMGKESRAGAIEDANAALEILEPARKEQPNAAELVSNTGKAHGILGRLETDPVKARRSLELAVDFQKMALEQVPRSHLDEKAMKQHQAALAQLPPKP